MKKKTKEQEAYGMVRIDSIIGLGCGAKTEKRNHRVYTWLWRVHLYTQPDLSGVIDDGQM